MSNSDICKIILAIFLPPVGVFLERGCGADFFINILLTILDEARQGFTDGETKQGVDYIAMTAASRYATADAIADEAAGLAFEGLTTEFTTATLRDLADVDAERLTEAYARFADGRWTVIVVGDATAHTDGIRALAHPVARDVTVVPG